MRYLISKQPKLALGVKIALAVMATGKVHGTPIASGTLPSVPNIATLLPQGVVRNMFHRDTTETGGADMIGTSKTRAQTLDAREKDEESHDMMTFEQARLWLQSYNAGPYATLKHKGNVPFRETRNYVPKVMKYYGQKLDDTPYEKYIVASAKKYGLDPQLIRAVMKTESNFNSSTVSHAGARGLMQVMPIVWTHVQKKYPIKWEYKSAVFDPEKNIEVACAYLAWLRYDFLPRHFADFDPNPDAPKAVVRDRGVPARKTPRLVVEAPVVPTADIYIKTVALAQNYASGSSEERAAKVALALVDKYGVQPAISLSDMVATKAVELKEEAGKINLYDLVMPAEPLKKKKEGKRVVSRNKKKSGRSS